MYAPSVGCLAALMDWEQIEQHFAGHFPSGCGRPALPPRLVAGLLYLQHANDALRASRGQHLAGEPITGRRTSAARPADRTAHRAQQPDALAPAHRREGVELLAVTIGEPPGLLD